MPGGFDPAGQSVCGALREATPYQLHHGVAYLGCNSVPGQGLDSCVVVWLSFFVAVLVGPFVAFLLVVLVFAFALMFCDQTIQNLTAPSDMRDLGLLPLARPYVP